MANTCHSHRKLPLLLNISIVHQAKSPLKKNIHEKCFFPNKSLEQVKVQIGYATRYSHNKTIKRTVLRVL